MNIQQPIVFLDIDGVCTALDQTPGSYLNHSQEEYGLSPKCMAAMKRFLKAANAVVIISSNWRLLKDKPKVQADGKTINNPIFMLKQQLGKAIAGFLPWTGIKRKATALVQWLDETQFDGPFVVIDDDVNEHIQDEFAYGINEHLLLTDYKTGFTNADIGKALEILNLK